MTELCYALSALPPEGLELTVDDQSVWSAPAAEFGLDCVITKPLKAKVFVMAQADGCFVRGHIEGEVQLPCDLCAARSTVTINQAFDSFEPMPGSGESDVDEDVMRLGQSGPEVHLEALLWQEFSLALPVHILCRPECAGLCASCGKDLNEGPCGCVQQEGDPRLAVLRGLKLAP